MLNLIYCQLNSKIMKNKNKTKNVFPFTSPSFTGSPSLPTLLPSNHWAAQADGEWGLQSVHNALSLLFLLSHCLLCSQYFGQRPAASSHPCLLWGMFGFRKSVLHAGVWAAIEESRSTQWGTRSRDREMALPVLQEPNYSWPLLPDLFQREIILLDKVIWEWLSHCSPHVCELLTWATLPQLCRGDWHVLARLSVECQRKDICCSQRLFSLCSYLGLGLMSARLAILGGVEGKPCKSWAVLRCWFCAQGV